MTESKGIKTAIIKELNECLKYLSNEDLIIRSAYRIGQLITDNKQFFDDLQVSKILIQLIKLLEDHNRDGQTNSAISCNIGDIIAATEQLDGQILFDTITQLLLLLDRDVLHAPLYALKKIISWNTSLTPLVVHELCIKLLDVNQFSCSDSIDINQNLLSGLEYAIENIVNGNDQIAACVAVELIRLMSIENISLRRRCMTYYIIMRVMGKTCKYVKNERFVADVVSQLIMILYDKNYSDTINDYGKIIAVHAISDIFKGDVSFDDKIVSDVLIQLRKLLEDKSEDELNCEKNLSVYSILYAIRTVSAKNVKLDTSMVSEIISKLLNLLSTNDRVVKYEIIGAIGNLCTYNCLDDLFTLEVRDRLTVFSKICDADIKNVVVKTLEHLRGLEPLTS